MTVSCTVFEIKRDICLKTPIFHTSLTLNLHNPQNPFEFLPKILAHNVQVPELLAYLVQKVLPQEAQLSQRDCAMPRHLKIWLIKVTQDHSRSFEMTLRKACVSPY